MDLGLTNILDGEGSPGILLEVINFGSLANRLADANGQTVAGRNRQRIGSWTLHPIFVCESLVAGAHPGVELLLPVTTVKNSFAVSGGQQAGVGDLTVAPFLQWSSEPKAGAVSARLGFGVVAPTGDYVPGRPVNTGQGGWQLSPYLAATWRASDRWEVSGRAIYDWSGSADSHTPAGAPDHVRPGELAAVNLATSYALTDMLRLGVGGYALRQLTNSRSGSNSLPDSRSQVFALGPVSRLEMGKVVVLFAAYGEFAARNRPEGLTMNLRIEKSF